MTTGFGVGLTAALVAALLFGLGAVVQAHAVRRMETPAVDLWDFLLSSARDPWTIGVVVAYLVGFSPCRCPSRRWPRPSCTSG